MIAGYLQFEPVFGQVDANLKRISHLLSDTAEALIVLPELALTGYFFQDQAEVMAVAEDPCHSDSVDRLVQLCKERNLFLVTGFAEKKGDVCYNSSLLLGRQGIIGCYRKLHLFNTEKKCFKNGTEPPEVYTLQGVRIGMMICFDWIFPEMARTLALKGADIVAQPSNLVIPGHCQRAMITRSVENRVYSITANRYGREYRPHGTACFTGASQMVTPNGSVLKRSGAVGDDLFTAEVDVQQSRNKHITDVNDILEDRRPEAYEM